MSKVFKYERNWNSENGTYTFDIVDKELNKVYRGKATCHDEDRDMMSEKVGDHLAFGRAYRKVIKDEIHDLRAGLRALNQLYYSVNKSKRYNEKDYVPKMLNRLIKIYESDIESCYDTLNLSEEAEQTYIDQKEQFYKEVRKLRNKKGENN